MRHVLLMTLLLVSVLILNGQSKNLKQQEFDFWIGEWVVYNYGTETVAGHSSIKPIFHHRAIEENYQALGSEYIGKSLNIYEESSEQWEQYWVDISGLRLNLKGGIVNDTMRLTDCAQGIAACNRIDWSDQGDGNVRQEWYKSSDGGKTWTKNFDGHYKPVKEDGVLPAFQLLENYDKVRDFTMNADGDEAYITIQSPLEEVSMIAKMQKIDGQWREPQLLNFGDKYRYLEASLSPDDLRLYFVSNRPISGQEAKDYDIWFVKRDNKDSEWSAPIWLEGQVNSEYDEFYPSLAANGNLYFTRDSPETMGKDDIFFAEWKSDTYAPAVLLSESINSAGYEFNSFIAPDESYLLYSKYNEKGGMRSGDLYISYRSEADGTWSKAENLGSSVNTKYMEFCPFVDSQTGTLYFTSRRSAVKAMSFPSLQRAQKYISSYENGESRIYKVDFEIKKKG